MLSGSVNGMLLTGPPNRGPYNRVCFWPEKYQGYKALTNVVKAALQNRQTVIKSLKNKADKTGEPLDALACPLFLRNRLMGVIALEMTHRSRPLQKAVVRQIQTGAKWLETMLLLHSSTTKEQLVDLVDLVAAGLENDQFATAATEVANELSKRFSCERVSIGFLRYNRIRIEAQSHSTKIDQNSNLVRAIRDTMSESLDQAATIVYPEEEDNSVLVTRFHTQLAKAQKGAAICTLPLVKNGAAVGAVVLERTADKPFTAGLVQRCEQIGLLIGPALETRRREERPLPLKIMESCQNWLAKLCGPRHLKLKLGVGLTTALLLCLCLMDSTFRISCDAVLEARVRRVVAAPQNGYIAATHARAGDFVRKGDLLATLDDRELLLEKRRWQSQGSQLLKEYRKALAGFERAEVAILKAKREQTDAHLKLVEQQIRRATIVAPLSGLIVKGDLSQSLGSPVTRGEVLYEVAPTDEYRVILEVDDRDIGLVTIGQQGKLKLSGVPDRMIPITIDRLTPVSTAEEGRNYFRVEAVMDDHSDLMRPGMEGITKIEIGEAKMLWVWTRRWVDGLRLFAWNWLP